LPVDVNDLEKDKDIWPPSTLKNWHEEIGPGTKWLWSDIIEIYTRCRLTMLVDRLIAIAGIAKEDQPVLDVVYLAGLWRKDLPHSLLWSLVNTSGNVKKSDTYRCKSSLHPPSLRMRTNQD
jgi:hypothetical protein